MVNPVDVICEHFDSDVHEAVPPVDGDHGVIECVAVIVSREVGYAISDDITALALNL